MDAALKIIIVDESRVRAAILEDGLREAGYINVVRIAKTRNLFVRVYAIDPDVIVIDLENPGAGPALDFADAAAFFAAFQPMIDMALARRLN
jgi:AmiR/NasT family two-component response regulator